MTRKIIFHYHLFKNAGTSLDAILKENFKDGLWVNNEFVANPVLNQQRQKEWVLSEAEAVCFSSHTAFFPVIDIEDVDIFPLIFMRHPLDRIISAYKFEATQKIQTFGSVLAKHTDLKGYIDVRLSLKKDHQCRNFHTFFFSKMFPDDSGSELDKAKKAIDCLPFVGDVGAFDSSLAFLEQKIKAFGFDHVVFESVKKNVSQAPKSLEEKLQDAKSQLGESFYETFVAANQNDIELYSYLQAKLEGEGCYDS